MSEESAIQDETPPADPAPEPKKKGSWIGLICKIVFFVGAFLLIVFTVMANIGGNNDTLKQSIEEFISENTPYKATVAQLNGMTFFPDISFDFERAELYTKTDITLAMTIQKFQVAFAFWDVMGSNGKIKALNIENFWAGENTLMKPPFALDTAKILETVDGPYLAGHGSVNESNFEFSASMDSIGTGRGKRYFFGPERDFKFRLGDIEVNGKIRTGKSTGVAIENMEVLQKKQKIMSGNIGVVRNGPVLTFAGDLDMAAHGSKISPVIDVILPMGDKKFEMRGKVESQHFMAADFAAGSPYDNMISTLEKIFRTDDTVTPPQLTIEADTAAGAVPMKGWHVETAKLKKPE